MKMLHLQKVNSRTALVLNFWAEICGQRKVLSVLVAAPKKGFSLWKPLPGQTPQFDSSASS